MVFLLCSVCCVMCSPLEFVFQEQSYSSLHSGQSLAWITFAAKLTIPAVSSLISAELSAIPAVLSLIPAVFLSINDHQVSGIVEAGEVTGQYIGASYVRAE